MGDSSKINNIYLSPDLNILPKSGEVKDLGILMSENCEFDNHIATVVKKCSRLCGWILLTFSTRSKQGWQPAFTAGIIRRLKPDKTGPDNTSKSGFYRLLLFFFSFPPLKLS